MDRFSSRGFGFPAILKTVAPVFFESTQWVTIRRAAAQDPDALEAFVARYRPAVLAYLRRSGFAEHDAEDLSQEVFLRLLSQGVLDRADRDRGRFRVYLFGLTRHVISEHARRQTRLKRGGGARTLSLEEDLCAAPVRDEAFDQVWLERMLDLALDGLRASHPDYHRALIGSAMEGRDQASLAGELGRSVNDIKNFVRRGREQLRAELKSQIAAYCSSAEEYRDEVAALSRYLDE